jgi:hypothetical protein
MTEAVGCEDSSEADKPALRRPIAVSLDGTDLEGAGGTTRQKRSRRLGLRMDPPIQMDPKAIEFCRRPGPARSPV